MSDEPRGRAEDGRDEAFDALPQPSDEALPPSQPDAHIPPPARKGFAHHAGRLRAYAKRHPVGALVWRAAVALVGASLLVAGGAMLVLPGPGWAAIALGLVVLASEFVWFEKPLRPVRQLLARAGERVGSPRRKRLVVALMVLVSLGSLIAYEMYLKPHGILP